MINFVNITEKEFLQSTLLYKHLPLENALRTLKNKSLWFANPMTWKDPFVRRFLEAKYTRNGKEVNFRWKGRVFCSGMLKSVFANEFGFTPYDKNGKLYNRVLLSQLYAEQTQATLKLD